MEKMRVILIAQFIFIAAAVAVQVGETITSKPNLLHSYVQGYESPKFRMSLTHCMGHGAETCNEANAGIEDAHGLAHCLFNSLEGCLKHHGAVLDQTSGTSTLPHQVQTIFSHCAHVSAKSCWTGPNIATSVLSACLIPSMNQCAYPN
ncbi:nodulin-20a-like [Gastrolobium bilobum]|uniref:nodulin-20a-like n=1 Tax=Gastrolobium bilobum TaxID=150636 RepID=UPI002AB02827|nr:nodulin-20a-like [Gastrolobium bilobum]